MDIKEEDFPLYQLLAKTQADNSGVQRAIEDFKKAQNGGDEEKYQFVHGIQTVATFPAAAHFVPGMTTEIRDKTLRSCLAVFRDVASRGHVGAKMMVAYYEKNGIGCDRKASASPKSPRP